LTYQPNLHKSPPNIGFGREIPPVHKEVIQWLKTFSTHKKSKRSSALCNRRDSHYYFEKYGKIDLEKKLDLSIEVISELQNLEFPEFNIIVFKELSNGNELMIVTMGILHHLGLFGKLKINPDVFIRFMRTIQSGYNDVHYHNKTHAADVV
jgi:hypothetical protein